MKVTIEITKVVISNRFLALDYTEFRDHLRTVLRGMYKTVTSGSLGNHQYGIPGSWKKREERTTGDKSGGLYAAYMVTLTEAQYEKITEDKANFDAAYNEVIHQVHDAIITKYKELKRNANA